MLLALEYFAVNDLKTESVPIMVEQSLRGAMFTVGHSDRTLDAFLALLESQAINRLIDVRTVPRSRHNPQFNRESLPGALGAVAIQYTHCEGLGGFRRTSLRSANTGWRNTSFRGYADYMQTQPFADNLNALITVAGHERVALMCAEAVPWRCHRSLIADALTVHGLRVDEIVSTRRCQTHVLTPFAHVAGLSITYPPALDISTKTPVTAHPPKDRV